MGLLAGVSSSKGLTSNYNKSLMETNSWLFTSPAENKARVKYLSSQQKDVRLSNILLKMNQQTAGQNTSKQGLFDGITDALDSKPQQEIIDKLENIATKFNLGQGCLQQVFTNPEGQLGKTHSYYVLQRILDINNSKILHHKPMFFAKIAKRAQKISNAVQFMPSAQQAKHSQNALDLNNLTTPQIARGNQADSPPPSRIFIRLDEALNLDKPRSEALSGDMFDTLWKTLDAELFGATDDKNNVQQSTNHIIDKNTPAGLLLQLLHHKKDAQQLHTILLTATNAITNAGNLDLSPNSNASIQCKKLQQLAKLCLLLLNCETNVQLFYLILSD